MSSTTTTRLDEIVTWIAKARTAMEENTRRESPSCEANHATLDATYGPKYIKLIVKRGKWERTGAVYCFLDYEGNIYKAAGFKAPAKGIRSTIEKKDPREISSSTGWLYAY